MAAKTVDMTAEAEIENTFPITGRGQVLVLKPGFQGTISVGAIIESDLGSARCNAVSYADAIGERQTRLCVIVADEFKGLFAAGQTIRFYRQPNEQPG